MSKERIIRDDEKLTKQKFEHLIQRFLERPGLGRLVWITVVFFSVATMLLVSQLLFGQPGSTIERSIEHAAPIISDIERAAAPIIERAAPIIKHAAPVIKHLI